jgi:hypothetical protein
MKNIFRKSSGLAPVLGILASLAGAVLHADSACVPVANGVPGTVLFTHPPNWWDPAPGAPLYNTALDAPSWRGAVAYGYANGAATTEEVHFRGLHRDDGLGNEFLYLSWWGKVVPSVTAGSNALWFGFHDGAGLGQDVAIGIQLVASADQAALQTGYVPTILVKPAGSADSAWAAYAGVPTVPAWINGAGAAGTARLWIQNAPSSWAVQVRVPITTSSDLNNGVRITSPFKSWYEFRAGTPDLITFPNGYITYKLPRAVADMDPVSGLPPAIAQWADARLTTGTPESPDPLCPTDGVSLKAENIGTNNPDPHSINLVSPNTLFAKPFNGSLTTAANNVRARFRIANWGTHASWEDVPNPNATLWTDIASPGGPVNIAANTLGNITTPYTATQCEACQYQVFYGDPTHTATCNASCPAATNNTRIDHQCLLVELTGTSVNFLNDSAYNNMNFANTSRFSEVAEVNLGGLKETAPGSLARDVYFYLETENMPARMSGDGCTGGGGTTGGGAGGNNLEGRATAVVIPPRIPREVCDPTVPRDERKRLIESLLQAGRLTYEDLTTVLPTYIVHAYYDTGQRRKEGAQTYPILHPLNSFGYFAMHDGVPAGWAYDLKDATKIAPNWYRIHVGPSGVATVRPVIETIEQGGGPSGFGSRLRLFLDLGPNFPHGDFGKIFDSRVSVNAGLERFVAPNTSLEGILGYHSFKSVFVGNAHIWQLSANVKQYFGTGPLHFFLNGGVGAYRFDPGSTTKFGGNAGTGLLYDLSADWGVEGVYNFHAISTSGSRTQFSTLQVGVRRRLF